jgi:hypothetical protein
MMIWLVDNKLISIGYINEYLIDFSINKSKINYYYVNIIFFGNKMTNLEITKS